MYNFLSIVNLVLVIAQGWCTLRTRAKDTLANGGAPLVATRRGSREH
jgi:hypothetical protein